MRFPARLTAGARLSVGLLTVVPVGAVRAEREQAGAAILCAPLVGAGLGAGVGLVAWGLGELGTSTLITGIGVVALFAALTRGLHLDGLADTADGLGSRKHPDGALAVMKASDIGPFGVLSILFAVLLQCVAAATLLARGPDHHAVALLALAAATARIPVVWACRAGLPAARPEGLGALVGGTVPGAAAAVWAGTALWVAALIGLWTDVGAARAVIAVGLALLAAAALLEHCRRRFGGMTGDVLGALVETAMTVALVVLSTT
ncbi:adenosylcobinamide-GDP ribazoletransferase [Sporichthya brevicatena]|uniref:Adenosylcobinamide-GDP ribazoletransferase n=1 Tax=Sporichthya brevicatena TaxID=171442 RepID=A0ABN1H644_9ACTN